MIATFRTEYQSLEKLWQQGVGGVEPLREYSKLIDIFYVLDDQGKKLVDIELQQEITQGLLYSVDYSVSQG